jgi:hypothetical protein
LRGVGVVDRLLAVLESALSRRTVALLGLLAVLLLGSAVLRLRRIPVLLRRWAVLLLSRVVLLVLLLRGILLASLTVVGRGLVIRVGHIG